MHVPDPMGRIHLILRDVNTTKNIHPRELLMDYTSATLYCADGEGKVEHKLSERIFQQMVAARLENAKIAVTHSDTDDNATEPTMPDVKDRNVNTWYVDIVSRSTTSED